MREVRLRPLPIDPDSEVDLPDLPTDDDADRAALRSEMMRLFVGVRSSYRCLVNATMRTVRELGVVGGAARCMLKDLHAEVLTFEQNLRSARKDAEGWDELHRNIDSDIAATQDFAADIRDQLDLKSD